MKKTNLKRITSFILALAMVADVIPLMSFPKAEAASNIDGTFEGQDAGIFSALGFDTSEIPEGYDSETVDNPYGRNKLTGNQVYEIMVGDAKGTKVFGKNNNNLTAESITGSPSSTGNNLVMSAVASGDFDGDGLAGEVAYVGYTEIQYNTWKTKSDLYLCVYDGETNTFSELKKIGNFNPAQVTTKGGTAYSRYDYVTGHTMITVNKRPITVQLPSLKINEGETLASTYTASEWNVVSGAWADCDIENEALIGNVATHVMNVTYRNTANTSLNASDVSKLCGAYTSHGRLAIAMTNYDVTIIDGSVAVLGGAHEVQLGVRSFEGKDVGALYAIAPDYATTRTTINQTDTLVQKHATGTRLVFTAVPDDGYAIYAWYINGIKQSTTDSTISYIMLNEETTIEVQFDVKKNDLTFGTAGDENGGTLICSDENLTSGSIILPNAYMTFTAQANEGYHFKEWRYTESGSGTAYDDTDSGLSESTFTLLMPTVSCSLYAVFERVISSHLIISTKAA